MRRTFILAVFLMITALLLVLNGFLNQDQGLFRSVATAQSAQNIGFRGNGVSITCSDDGRYVYAAGSGKILRSTDFGKSGTWEIVVEN
jgi:hypothetical protein